MRTDKEIILDIENIIECKMSNDFNNWNEILGTL